MENNREVCRELEQQNNSFVAGCFRYGLENKIEVTVQELW